MAMRDEPEALTAEEYAVHVDKRAREAAEQQRKFETAQREKERRLMTFDQRLAKAQLEARSRCIDISSDVRLLRHLERAGKKVRHLESRLHALERKVWR